MDTDDSNLFFIIIIPTVELWDDKYYKSLKFLTL